MYFGPMPGYRNLPIIVSIIATFPQVAGAQQRQAKTKPREISATSQGRPTPVAGPPRLTIEPKDAVGGSLVRVTIDGLARNDSARSATGEMAGEPLRFVAASNGRLQALGVIPVDSPDSLIARAVVVRASGATDSLHVLIKIPHEPPPQVGRGARLSVDSSFTKPLDTKTEERVARENQLARDVGRRAQQTPPLWTFPFLRPREATVTSRFGTGRVFNGKLTSRHLGVDYRGALGQPIYAANRGVVALVANFFLAGNVVYIDHGGGLVTGYFHMSKPLVAAGDTVERGQKIGLVGATGRVTGPHLHWSARFGALTFDPADLLTLSAPFTRPDAPKRKPNSKKG
jgi:murein DD-endopeptidase MepM/ murein hydrolase activator NlpD